MHGKKPIPGEFKNEWRPCDETCPRCRRKGFVEMRAWESSDTAYEDDQYRCSACSHSWWVEGPDA